MDLFLFIVTHNGRTGSRYPVYLASHVINPNQLAVSGLWATLPPPPNPIEEKSIPFLIPFLLIKAYFPNRLLGWLAGGGGSDSESIIVIAPRVGEEPEGRGLTVGGQMDLCHESWSGGGEPWGG